MRMPWTTIQRHDYAIALVDGFVDPLRVTGDPRCPQEQRIAERLVELALLDRSGKRRENAPDPVHVFVIGKRGWTCKLPDPFSAIAEAEDRDDYRTVIVGLGVDPICPYIGGWNSWLRVAGIPWKKYHRSRAQFRESAHTILEPLAEIYLESRVAPKRALERFHVPFAYAGSDHYRSREDSF